MTSVWSHSHRSTHNCTESSKWDADLPPVKLPVPAGFAGDAWKMGDVPSARAPPSADHRPIVCRLEAYLALEESDEDALATGQIDHRRDHVDLRSPLPTPIQQPRTAVLGSDAKRQKGVPKRMKNRSPQSTRLAGSGWEDFPPMRIPREIWHQRSIAPGHPNQDQRSLWRRSPHSATGVE